MDFSKLSYPPGQYHTFIDIFSASAKSNSEDILLRYQDDDGTYQTLSYRQVDIISNNMACKLYKKHGVSGQNVCVMTDQSIRYALLILALLKLNCQLLLLSTRNSVPALTDLIAKTETKIAFHTTRYHQSISEAVKDNPIKLVEIPSVYDVHEPEMVEEAKQILGGRKTDKQDLEKIALIIHSSGSTKFPKPIRLSNRYLIILSHSYSYYFKNIAPPSLHFDKSLKKLAFAPLFHVMGIIAFFGTINAGGQLIFPAKYPPSSNEIVDSIRKTSPTLLIIPPLLLEHLAHHLQNNPSDWEYLKNLEAVFYGGAALPNPVAKYLQEGGINVKSVYGTTEIGVFGAANLDPADHDYCAIKFVVPEQYIKLEKVDETHRKLFVKADNPMLASGLPIEDGYYNTNDLWYEKAPGSGYWYISGRADDTLIMLNGEKTNPLPMEEVLREVDVVKACTVIGHGRECTAALIQLNVDKVMERDLREVISEVEKAVQDANRDAPAHSKLVYPQMVKILPLKDSLPITDKGTVSRARSEKIFTNEIEKMYSDFLSKGSLAKDATGSKVQLTESGINDFLHQTITKILGRSTAWTSDDQNLFDSGFDSLMAVQLRNNIIKTIGDVPQNFIFENPTIKELTHFLTSGKDTSTVNTVAKRYQETLDILAKYINRINQDFPHAAKTSTSQASGHVVLLTGATGSLGSFLLRDLIKDKSVTKIYALIRGNNLKGRLQKSFSSRGIDTSLLESGKVEVLPMNLTDLHLGLTDADFNRIQKEVTIICHCAWMLDFLQPISYYDKECIVGLYHLIKFAFKDGNNPMRVHFISSISAAMNIKPKVLEEPLPNDPKCTLPIGYAQSKYIAERLLNYLTQNKNIPCYVERVGQMTGDTDNGAWNPQEQYPLMIAGGVRLKKMPEMGGQVDWIPYDYASAVIVGIMTKTAALPASLDHSTYHVVNPNTVKWNDYLQALKECGLKFEIVKPSEWLKALSEDVENPAFKLMSFYEGMMRDDQEHPPVFSTAKAEQVVSTIKDSPKIDSKIVKKYLQFWYSIKFMEAQQAKIE